jgi:hypothetical protein
LPHPARCPRKAQRKQKERGAACVCCVRARLLHRSCILRACASAHTRRHSSSNSSRQHVDACARVCAQGARARACKPRRRRWCSGAPFIRGCCACARTQRCIAAPQDSKREAAASPHSRTCLLLLLRARAHARRGEALIPTTPLSARARAHALRRELNHASQRVWLFITLLSLAVRACVCVPSPAAIHVCACVGVYACVPPPLPNCTGG